MERFSLFVCVFYLNLIPNLSLKPNGHYLPLGSNMPPLGVTLIGKFSSPNIFYEFFVKESRPLLMKSVLTDDNFPAYVNWKNGYLDEVYGFESVSVEQSKKERRNISHKRMKLSKFLATYKTENVYLVHSLPDSMKADVRLPVTLQCGGFQNVLQDSVFWMSSGKTKSVLHYDKLDNLLCVLQGSKDILLIDKVHQAEVEADGFVANGTYSTVDVDSVNMHQFPKLKEVPWHRAHLQAGDCLYIPYKWYHQVNSSGGPERRNLALNFWFSHLWWHNSSDCNKVEKLNSTEPLVNFPFASPNEQMRSYILEPFDGLETVSLTIFKSSLLADELQVEQLFKFIKGGNSHENTLTWEELYSFDIDDAVMKFPEVFDAGVKQTNPKLKKTIERETIVVQDNSEEDASNFVDIPMMVPGGEDYDEALNAVVDVPTINVKVTKPGQGTRSKDPKEKADDSVHQERDEL